MQPLDYELIRSKRKSVSLGLNKDATPIVRAPMRMPKHEIDKFVLKHTDWLIDKIEKVKHRRENEVELSPSDIANLKTKGLEIITRRADFYSRLMGVTYTGIKMTSANSRWGSCSYKNSLCFSYRLMLLPQRLIDYVIVHELAHIKEKNHSSRFYKIIEQYMPDYKDRVAEMKKGVADTE